MRFSERIEKRTPKVDIQIDYMDIELRNGLWNILTFRLIKPLESQQYISDSSLENLVQAIWFSFLKEPIDEIPYSIERIVDQIRKRFYNWDYLDVYDFIDFIAKRNNDIDTKLFISDCNYILKRELSGYRFIIDQLSPITSEIEINEIEKAISNSFERDLKGVNIHLKESLNKISDKKNPDYRNSIKESISAVESLCQSITRDPKAELGKALKLIKTHLSIHPALEKGFKSIYGYTSDGDGIRHALLNETNLDQEDALFMLISCSAFINYLISKMEKLNIK